MRHHIDDSMVLAIEVPVDDNPRDTGARLSRFSTSLTAPSGTPPAKPQHSNACKSQFCVSVVRLTAGTSVGD